MVLSLPVRQDNDRIIENQHPPASIICAGAALYRVVLALGITWIWIAGVTLQVHYPGG